MVHVEEIWVEVGVGAYAVSNYGTVTNERTGRDLKPYPDKRTGLLRVALYHNGKRWDVFVHRLVAKAFFLNYGPGIEVLHKNQDVTDNSVLNLTLGGPCRKGADGPT